MSIVGIDVISRDIKAGLEKHFVGYKYVHVDHFVEVIEDVSAVRGPNKFFIFKTFQKIPYEVVLDNTFIVNYTDVQEKVKYLYGIDKYKKKIYWKYNGSERY